jgi:hypothetical protein
LVALLTLTVKLMVLSVLSLLTWHHSLCLVDN